MATELAAQNASSAPVVKIDNLRKGAKERMKAVRATIGGMVDLKLFEPLLGKKTMVDPALLKKRLADGQYTLEVVLQEQNRVAKEKPTIVELVGTPGQRTQLREWVIALVDEALFFKRSTVDMACLLRPNHPSLAGVNALLNGAALHLSKELEWPVKNLPTITLVGVGLDQGAVPGHVAEIAAAAKAMAEEDVKRIAALPKQ